MDNEKKIFTRIEDFSLFEPTGKENSDLRIEFPELQDEEAFKVIQSRELRFVWLMANRTSPIITVDKEKRCLMAVSIIWGKDWEESKQAVGLQKLQWSPNIMKAMKRMAEFNPTVRLRARLMTEYAFDQLQTIIIATPTDIKNMDFDSRKKYAELLLNVNARLPEVVNNMERGYGITIKKSKDEIKINVSAAGLSNELGNDK